MATKKPAKKRTKTSTSKAQTDGKKIKKKNGAKSEDPIIIRGGGSVAIKFNNGTGKFKNMGSGKHRHPTATLVNIYVNGTKVADLTSTDEVKINLA